MKKNIKLYISAGLMLLFVVFTLLLSFVDVKSIGTYGSNVGFATMNEFFSNLIKDHPFFFLMAQFYGYITIGVACLAFIFAVVLVILRKSIKKLDKEFYALFGLYALTAIVLVLFTYVFKLNYRAFLFNLNDYKQVVSYPAIQIVTSVVVYGSAITIIKKFVKDKDLYQPLEVIIYAFVVLIVAACIVSGFYWVSDIIGAGLISTSLLFAFKYVCEKIGDNSQNETK